MNVNSKLNIIHDMYRKQVKMYERLQVQGQVKYTYIQTLKLKNIEGT